MAGQDFDHLFKSLRKGEIPNALYLHGPEDVLKEEAIAEIVTRVLDPSLKDFNFDQRSAGSLTPEDAETLCQTLPMMSDRRIVIIRDVETWNKRAKAKATVLRFLERPSPETILVLVQGSGEADVDPELAAKTVSVAAEPLPPDRAKRWLLLHAERLGVKIDDDAAEHMVKVTDSSLSDLRSELAKLASLEGSASLTLARVSEFLGVRHGETQYDWRDLVLAGKAGPAAAILPHLLAQTGVSGVSLVTLLGTNLLGIGLARSIADRGNKGPAQLQAIKTVLFRTRPRGISYDAAAVQWSRLANDWPRARIERGLIALRRADERLKNTAVSDERSILFDLVMELALPWQRAA